MTGRKNRWPEAKVERFKAMWADGCHVSIIADAMGITELSVRQKRFELGLPPRRKVHRMKRAAPKPVPAIEERPGWPSKQQLMAGR